MTENLVDAGANFGGEVCRDCMNSDYIALASGFSRMNRKGQLKESKALKSQKLVEEVETLILDGLARELVEVACCVAIKDAIATGFRFCVPNQTCLNEEKKNSGMHLCLKQKIVVAFFCWQKKKLL